MKRLAALKVKDDGSFELHCFGFSKPFSEACRAIPSRKWNGSTKVWTFPAGMASHVKALCDNYDIKMPKALASVKAEDAAILYDLRLITENGILEVAISFPYNVATMQRLKSQVPATTWEKETKTWRTPLENLTDAIKWAKYNGLQVDPEATRRGRAMRLMFDAAVTASFSQVSDFEAASAIELKPYQRTGVERLVTLKRAILGDEPGLGKTVQALSAAYMENAFPLIVVTPNSMKPTWAKVEVPKFFPFFSVQTVTGTKRDPLPYADVTVINYDILAARVQDLIAMKPKGCIIDESHYIRNGNVSYLCPACMDRVRINAHQCRFGHEFIEPLEKWSVRRTEGVMKLIKSVPDDGVVYLLTGTPVHNRPTDLIPQLTAVGRIREFGGPYAFRAMYFRDGTPSHMMELNDRLRRSCYIRREKMDVYKTLPELTTTVVLLPVPKSKMAEYKKIERDVIEHLAQRAREIAVEAGKTGDAAYIAKKMRAQAAEHLVRISVLKNAAASLKLEVIREWITDFMEDTQKLIVFAEHVEMVESLTDTFKEKSVKIRGGVKMKDRLIAVDRFQNDDSIRLFFGNLAAASEGITLTAASNVAFCELPWTWETVRQAAARCYGRVNDLHGAVAHFLLAEGTIDETIYRLLDAKKKMSEAITSGVDPETNVSILQDLVIALAKRGAPELLGDEE